MMRSRLLCLSTALLLAACSGGDDPTPSPDTGAVDAKASSEPATPAPVATDEAGLRSAAARALAEQRLYSPAGDNAIEHYLALRQLAPADTAVETALVELLPYALIGSEQAVAREDFAEARRLIALVERSDPALPALSRLRDGLAVAEVEAAQRAQAQEAEALARAEAARREPLPTTTTQAPTVSAPTAPPAVATSPPAAPATRAPAATPLVAAQPSASPAPPAVPTRTPRLLDAPPPRYPLMALRRKLEGEVMLELTVRPDGSVGAARVISATPPGLFDEAATAAVERWRFEAGPGIVTTRQQVRFRLPGADRPAG